MADGAGFFQFYCDMSQRNVHILCTEHTTKRYHAKTVQPLIDNAIILRMDNGYQFELYRELI